MTTEIERVEFPDRVEYRLNGKLHRTDGPALEWVHGYSEWFLNGLRHRTTGPAIQKGNGTKMWYLNDKLHRTNGPAIEWANGVKEWYLNHRKVSKKEVDEIRCNMFLKSLVLNRRSYKFLRH
jgi:hypothetical protein